MNVNVSIGFTEGDEGFEMSAAEVAQKVLDALGGDPDKDMVMVNMNATASVGGMVMTPPPPVQVLETKAAPESDG